MERKDFWDNLFDGISSLFPWTGSRLSYEERFGTDKDQLASDWRKVGDDIRNAMGISRKKYKS